MERIIIPNAAEALRQEQISRFHFLQGEAVYEADETNGIYRLTATAVFPATEEYPTVLDRSRITKTNQPHVNATDSQHAVWNAAHLIANKRGLLIRNLRGRIVINLGNKTLMPNTPYHLKTTITDKQEIEIEGKTYKTGKLGARFYNETNDSLPSLEAYWITKPLNLCSQ
jgi:hypothetical protein